MVIWVTTWPAMTRSDEGRLEQRTRIPDSGVNSVQIVVDSGMNTRVMRAVGLATLAVVVLVLLWFSRRMVLLLFAALLIALILTSLTHLLQKVLPLRHKFAFGLVLLLLTILISVTSVILATTMSDQFSELADRLPKLFSDARERVEQSPAYQKATGLFGDPKDIMPSGGAGKMASSAVSSTFQMASSFVFIVFSAIFLAASPGLYMELLIKLFPPHRRAAARETVTRVLATLKQWLLGQAVSMSVVGVMTGVALAIAGIPFAAALGLIAGLAEFIPLAGPILASIPALLLAASEGTDKVLIVLGIFLVIQFLEGNVIMPIVQRKAVHLPPVVTLVALLVLGEAFGLLGMFVAAPLAAMVLVLVEEVYVRRVLQTDDQLAK